MGNPSPLVPGVVNMRRADLPVPEYGYGTRYAKRFFVDQVNGSDGNNGHVESPFETIAKAYGLAVSGRGDQIVIFPGSYEENLVIAKDYLAIVGAMRGGYARPDIVPATGIPLSVHAQGVYLARLRTAPDAAAVSMRLQGNGYRVEDCVIDGEAASDCLLLLPDLDDDSYTASEGFINHCLFRGGLKGIRFKNPGPGVEGGVGPSDNLIYDCDFVGIGEHDLIDEDTPGSNDTTFLNSRVHGCRFMDRNKAGYIKIDAGGNNTGLISGNYFADDAGLDATKIDLNAGIVFAGNFQAAGVVDGSTF